MTAIKEIPVSDRPRERFLSNDIESIQNEELISILLNSGYKGTNVKVIANEVLALMNQVNDIKEITVSRLTSIKGIGEVKAITFLASLELGRRFSKPRPILQNTKITNSKLVYEYYYQKLVDKRQEYFYCIYLDNQKKIIKEKLLFIGTINHSTIHPREIFKEAYLNSASGILCIHNHPSGEVNPSKTDIQVTENLKKVGVLLGIPLIDHIIIGETKYYSFFENGLL